MTDMRPFTPFRAGPMVLLAAALAAAPVAVAPAFAQSPDAEPLPDVGPLPNLPAPDDRTPNLLEPPAELPSARPHAPGGDPAEALREPSGKEEPSLDALFADLAKAGDDRTAKQIADRIQRRLAASGSATIDVLMVQAQGALADDRLPVALDLLDAVTRLKPDYAEGWSRRAAVHYQRDDYGKALADLEHALVLEPRDWRTLVGLGVVLNALDREEAALKAYEAALAVHPRNEDARKAHDKLAASVRGVEL